jgi:DNA-binding response OmpR family regulator
MMACILIADDSLIIQRILSLTLRKAGYEVRVADDGKIALDMLAQEPVDILIADLSMPEVDGIELLRRVRADLRHAKLPVVMLTASGQDQDREVAREMGASAFLTKPASSGELLATIDRLLPKAAPASGSEITLY